MNLNFKLFLILSTSYFKRNLFKYDLFHIHETFYVWLYHKGCVERLRPIHPDLNM